MSNKNKENVVLIVCDCLRYDCAYNENLMPFLSSLRKKKNYYHSKKSHTNAPGTYFAMPTMLTGYMPFERTDQAGINNQNIERYTPKLFGKIGYISTAITANIVTSRAFGYNRYWDTFIDLWKERKIPIKPKLRANQIFKHLKKIELKKYKNFIYLHFMDTHSPYIPAGLTKIQKDEAMSLFTKLIKNKTCLILNDISIMKSLYHKECKYLDKYLKIVIEHLKKNLDWQKTKLIITSDHGEAFYETNYLQHERDHIDNIYHLKTPLITKNIKLKNKSYWTTDIYNMLVSKFAKKVKTYSICVGYKKISDSVADVKDRLKKPRIKQTYIPYKLNNLKQIQLVDSMDKLPYKCRKNYVHKSKSFLKTYF